MFSSTQPSGSCVTVLIGGWFRTLVVGLQVGQANLVFKHLRVLLWFQPPGLQSM